MKETLFRLMLMGLVISAYAQCFAEQKGEPKGNQTVREQAPFQMPPSGKPELLASGIDFEGPSALALSEDGGRTWTLATTATFLRRRLSKGKGKPSAPGDADKQSN